MIEETNFALKTNHRVKNKQWISEEYVEGQTERESLTFWHEPMTF